VEKMLYILSSSIGISVTQLGQTIETKAHILNDLLAALEKAGLLLRVMPYGAHTKQVRKPSKYLFARNLNPYLQEYLSNVHKDSEEILIITNELAKAKLKDKISSFKWFPQVDLEVQAGYVPLDDRSPQGGALAGGQVLLKWELFSGLDTHWERKEKAANLLKQQAKLKQALLELGKDPADEEILAKFGALRFIETTTEDYQPVFDLALKAGIDIKNYIYRNR